MGPIPIDLDGFFGGLILFGIALGAIFTLVFMFFVPWLWSFIKPWLHAVTG